MNTRPPCKNCACRTFDCHAHCPTYQEWAQRRRKLLDEIYQTKQTDVALTEMEKRRDRLYTKKV